MDIYEYLISNTQCTMTKIGKWIVRIILGYRERVRAWARAWAGARWFGASYAPDGGRSVLMQSWIVEAGIIGRNTAILQVQST